MEEGPLLCLSLLSQGSQSETWLWTGNCKGFYDLNGKITFAPAGYGAWSHYPGSDSGTCCLSCGFISKELMGGSVGGSLSGAAWARRTQLRVVGEWGHGRGARLC